MGRGRAASELRTLGGHNDAVFDLAFRPDGKMLASASGDRTVKLWDVATGERLDTFGQPLKELYTVAFSPDGRRVAAGGVDNRIRVWQVSPDGQGKHQPDSLFAVRPRRGGGQAGLLGRRQDARLGGRRPHASRSGTPTR